MTQFFKKERQKVQKFVENKSFDLFILALICLDSIVLGMMTSSSFNANFGGILYLLDRLCLAIFIVEMILKLYVYGKDFFKSNWNTFDFSVVALSSVSFATSFIIFRAFRLFRALKYINRFSKLKHIINVFSALLPNFVAFMLVFAVLLYVFAITAVNLFGGRFLDFASLPDSVFALLQVFSMDGWAEIAKGVMYVYPHSWIFFALFVLASSLLSISFVMSVVDEIFKRDLKVEISSENKALKKQSATKIAPSKKPRGKTGRKKSVSN
ncbi:MAG: ion transporter [Alphaproteobacteria bacterium]|nr:ion transporter [Alphaproteobacteria bacterium]